MPIDHCDFMRRLKAEFPEVSAGIDENRAGLLHLEMGAFARCAEEAMDRKEYSRAQKYFEFIERMRIDVTPEVENAIDISFIEFLALSSYSDERYNGLLLMPSAVRSILIRMDGRGRWDASDAMREWLKSDIAKQSAEGTD